MRIKKNCTLADINEKLQSGEKLTTLEEIFYLLNVIPKVATKNISTSGEVSPTELN